MLYEVITLFFFVKFTLKAQLRQQLALLRPLAGDVTLRGETVEDLHTALESSSYNFV